VNRYARALGKLLIGQTLGFAHLKQSPNLDGIVAGSSHGHHPAQTAAAVQVGVTRHLQSSYVVVTEGGVNYLQRRTNGVQPQTIVSNVERVAFDDTTTSGFVVPLDAIRVRVWFRAEDQTGLAHRYFVETTIKLRNG